MRLLNPFSDKSHQYALDKLTEHGVKVTFGVAVTQVGPDTVQLSDGTELPTRTVVWGGGESASPVAAATGAKPGRGGRIDVAPDLSVPGFDGVFAVGDVANIPGPGDRALPQLGSVAQQSGKWAGKNILALIDGKKTTPFHYHDKGIMAMIGRNAAVAEVGAHRHQVEGPIAFAAWLGLHAILLSGAHSRSTRSSTGPTTTSTTTVRPIWSSKGPPTASPGPMTPPTVPPFPPPSKLSRGKPCPTGAATIIGSGAGGGTLAHRLARPGSTACRIDSPRGRD